MRVIGVAGVALCAAAMLAAGCSGGRDIVPLETVANAAFKTESVGTARLSFEGTVTFNHDHAQRFEFTGHGIADWRTGSSKMTAAYKFGPRFRKPSSSSSAAPSARTRSSTDARASANPVPARRVAGSPCVLSTERPAGKPRRRGTSGGYWAAERHGHSRFPRQRATEQRRAGQPLGPTY